MKRADRLVRLLYLSLVFYSLFALSFRAFAQESGRQIAVLTIRGPVTPIFASYIGRGIQEAQAAGAEMVVIQLDTPGGSVQIMEDVVERMTESKVPVVAYVTPSGGKAASAGTFIVLAAHLAAMAPNTSIGAASPVSMQGQEMSDTEARKTTNVLVAKIKGLAANRGSKAVDWAEKAVRDAAAATEQEALELGVIDMVAPDLPTLLNELDGRQVKVGQELVTLHSQGATTVPIDMTPVEQFLHVLTDPNIAFILLTLGLNGLLFELANPGAVFPGVVGGVCLLLGFYALGVLNVNYTGLGFMALAFLLFLADIKAPSHGILTVGGIISFVLGALILFNTPYQPVSRGLVVGVALVTAAFFAFAVSAGVRAQRRKTTTGQAGMIGATAETRSELNPEGVVFVSGELWRAVADEGNVPRGQSVQVVGIDGMRLRVRKIH